MGLFDHVWLSPAVRDRAQAAYTGTRALPVKEWQTKSLAGEDEEVRTDFTGKIAFYGLL